jgi:hypothetical protein
MTRNLLSPLRQRLGATLGILAFSAFCCLSGIFLTFVLAPGQALQARRVARMPIMNAAAVESASPGDLILVTGNLTGNPPARSGSELVAYDSEEWEISYPDNDEGDNQPRGDWSSLETIIPELTLDLNGNSLDILADNTAHLNGNLREEIVEGHGSGWADYDGMDLPEGSRRFRGVRDGDLVTVYGEKSSTGGVIPDEIFAGDRVAFEENQRQQATGLLYAGLCSILLAPIILLGGFVSIIRSIRRRR